MRRRVAAAPADAADRVDLAVEHGGRERAARRRQRGERPPAVARRIVFVHLVGRRPAVDVAADDIELALQAHRGRVMQRARNGGAAAPAVGGRIVDFELALAAEPADHVDFAVHLGHRHLGARGGHRGARGPAAGALRQGRGTEERSADQQRRSEGLESCACRLLQPVRAYLAAAWITMPPSARYSITSSARASSVGGTVRPSALAVLRLIDQLVLRRRLHRKVGRLLALEDAIDVAGRAPVRVDEIGPVGDQAAAGRRRSDWSRPRAVCAAPPAR